MHFATQLQFPRGLHNHLAGIVLAILQSVERQPCILLLGRQRLKESGVSAVIRIAVAAGKERTCPQPGMNPWNRRSPSHFHRSGIGAMI